MNIKTAFCLLFGIFAAGSSYTYGESLPSELSDDMMFYIGDVGYDGWADVYSAAQVGDTITVGQNAIMAPDAVKPITIDLAGRALEWEASGWMRSTLTVIDSVGGGHLTLTGYSRNVGDGTVDLSALTADQFSGSGIFWTSAATVIKFPSGMTLNECTSKLGNRSLGQKIVLQEDTYIYDGSSWVLEGPGCDITIAECENGIIETSVTNGVSVGTKVTVIATPSEGYRLDSVEINGVALAEMTFQMPSENVTISAIFKEMTPMFYIGEVGYESWSDAYSAAQNGDTIILGRNATMEVRSGEGKKLTIDLAGYRLEWAAVGWMYDTRSVVDSVGGGQLKLIPDNRNVGSGTIDLSALYANQLTGTGKFYTNASTVLKFPGGMALAECTARIANKADGQKIVVDGITYIYNGVKWKAKIGFLLHLQ